MEGAIESGERAAREVLHREGRVEADDILQTEPFQDGFLPDDPITYTWIEWALPSVSSFLWVCVACGVALAAVLVKDHFM